MPDAVSEPRVDVVPHRIGRHDVEHGELFEAAGMIEGKAVGHAAAAVVAGERKVRVAELLHHLDHRRRHRPLGVGRMILRGFRHRRPAVAREIRDHEAEAFAECGRYPVPHDVGLGVAVQQHQRRSAAARAGKDAPRRGVDPM
jgi:hypothetical protein